MIFRAELLRLAKVVIILILFSFFDGDFSIVFYGLRFEEATIIYLLFVAFRLFIPTYTSPSSLILFF